MSSQHLVSASEYVVIAGGKGVYLHSKEGGFHLNNPGDDSFFVVDTKNLVSIRTNNGFINIVDDGKVGMVNIQAETLLNLAILDSTNTKFTGLNIIDGQTHIGAFTPTNYDRLHIESKKIKLESAAGPAGVGKELGKVEVTPTKVTIECLESTMEVDVNGFSWQNAAKSFKMVLLTSKFLVEDVSTNNKFEIDLSTQTVSIGGFKLALESTINTTIQNLETSLRADIAQIKLNAVAVENKADAISKDQAAIKQEATDAIKDIRAILQNNKIK